MRVIILANYFYPEFIGAGIWITQLAQDLSRRGHSVQVITSFPSYPTGVIFEGYSNQWRLQEQSVDFEIIRTWTYANPSKAFWPRVITFGSFCVSSALGYVPGRKRADVVYAILPPLPLGISAWLIAKASCSRLVVNIQDIYPDIAESLGYLKNRRAIQFFQWMERWIYKAADLVSVISEGFKSNLVAKGISPSKIQVMPNWADSESIEPMNKQNSFRRELGLRDEFVVLYSGGLTANSDLDVLLDAAAQLRQTSVQFVIVGDGIRKEHLIGKAKTLALANIAFVPFQPIERYPEVLAAADLTVVSLHSAATFASVPSKIYKQMAAGRPILALTNSGNELTRLLDDSGAGICVSPADSGLVAEVIHKLSGQPSLLESMGHRARSYLEQHHDRKICIDRIENMLAHVCSDVRTID